MNTKSNRTIADKIFEKIPPDVKAVDYLMGLLDLSRESVYRRKRGELPFAFREIAVLAEELDFSVDDLLVDDVNTYAVFSHKTDMLFDPRETFLMMLEKYYELYKRAFVAKSFDASFTINRMLLTFLLDSDYLFRFLYFMWIHQGYNVPPNFRYSDAELPPEMVSLPRKVWEYARYASNTTIIADERMFKNMFQDIEYYYKKKLLTKEEFVLLKEELLSYIRRLETIVLSGMNRFGAKYNIYLSRLNIESNSCCVQIDGEVESFFGVFGSGPLYTQNSTVFMNHRRWIDSLKKYSILISQSNELLQGEFFNGQYRFVQEASERLLK